MQWNQFQPSKIHIRTFILITEIQLLCLSNFLSPVFSVDSGCVTYMEKKILDKMSPELLQEIENDEPEFCNEPTRLVPRDLSSSSQYQSTPPPYEIRTYNFKRSNAVRVRILTKIPDDKPNYIKEIIIQGIAVANSSNYSNQPVGRFYPTPEDVQLSCCDLLDRDTARLYRENSKDQHASNSFIWIPGGYQEDFEGYLEFVATVSNSNSQYWTSIKSKPIQARKSLKLEEIPDSGSSEEAGMTEAANTVTVPTQGTKTNVPNQTAFTKATLLVGAKTMAPGLATTTVLPIIGGGIKPVSTEAAQTTISIQPSINTTVSNQAPTTTVLPIIGGGIKTVSPEAAQTTISVQATTNTTVSSQPITTTVLPIIGGGINPISNQVAKTTVSIQAATNSTVSIQAATTMVPITVTTEATVPTTSNSTTIFTNATNTTATTIQVTNTTNPIVDTNSTAIGAIRIPTNQTLQTFHS